MCENEPPPIYGWFAGLNAVFCDWGLPCGGFSLRKDIHNRFALAIFRHVERSSFDREFGLRTHTHGSHYGSVKIGHSDGVFDSNERPFVRSLAVEMPSLDAAAEGHHAGAPGEVAVKAVVLLLGYFFDFAVAT